MGIFMIGVVVAGGVGMDGVGRGVYPGKGVVVAGGVGVGVGVGIGVGVGGIIIYS